MRGIVVGTLMVACVVVATSVRGQTSFADPLAELGKTPAVELPPMMVTEAADAPPWLYAQVNGMEYLSRCSAATTRLYAEYWERAMHRLWHIVPDALLPRRELAGITIVYSQKLARTTSPELLEALKHSAPAGGRFGGFASDLFYRFAPNMRLSDRDVYATFAYLDEMHFDAERMSVAPGYVQFMLERRVPELPGWFVVGIMSNYRKIVFARDEIELPRIFWVDQLQTTGLSRDAEHPRALLPASELFAHDALRGKLNGNFQRTETLMAQATLFVRWALETSPATREALWKFAARTAEEAPSDALFTTCFGFGYSELRDRLSDYLPQAINQVGRYNPGKLARVPRPAVRRATPGEIARLRGEWERLAADYVQKTTPQLRGRYLEQARGTLRRAFDAGDRDPRLLTALGLTELVDSGAFGARFFLEPATAAGVTRPRAHYELARLRLTDLRRPDPKKMFTASELAPVLEPLRKALLQAPPLPEVFALFADAWFHCVTPPPAADVALLERGAQLFARTTEASLPLALALARHGHKDAAARLLAAGADHGRDETTRQRFIQIANTLGLPNKPSG